MNWKSANKSVLDFVGAASHVILVGPLAEPMLIPSEGLCIFVDGGAKFSAHRSGLRIGDGDSYPLDLDVRLPQDKDISDLGFVLESLPQKVTTLTAVGFLGGRKDHEWLNIGAFHQFLSTRRQAQVSLDSSIRFFSAGTASLKVQGVFSLLSLDPVLITLTGSCRFPLNTPTRIERLSSRGLSNVGAGLVTLETDAPVLLMMSEESEWT